jgi:hypothetical protein
MLKPSLAERLRAVVGTAPSAVPRVQLGEREVAGDGAPAAERVRYAAAKPSGASASSSIAATVPTIGMAGRRWPTSSARCRPPSRA